MKIKRTCIPKMGGNFDTFGLDHDTEMDDIFMDDLHTYGIDVNDIIGIQEVNNTHFDNSNITTGYIIYHKFE